MARLLWQNPRLFVRWVCYLAVGYGIAFAGFGLAGRLDLLARYGYLLFVPVSQPIIARLVQLRERDRQQRAERSSAEPAGLGELSRGESPLPAGTFPPGAGRRR